MNILNDVVSGAARQFGREFGRAGANSILKGANSYTVKGISDYSGRIKPSDSDIVRSIKEINKVSFVSVNKGNVSRLIELTDTVNSHIEFKGIQTLNELSDINELVNQYNDKFNHGSAMIDDDFKDKSVAYLEERRQEFVDLLGAFNKQTTDYVSENLKLAESKKKLKKTALLYIFPLLGFQWFYLGSNRNGILSILFCWTSITPIVNLIHLFQLISMDNNKFDMKYNPEYRYFSQFTISNS